MPLSLSLNTNPLVNRFADPDDPIDTVARSLRIGDLQLTHEFINPSWPAQVIRRLTRQMAAACARTGVRVTSGMTGPYGRLNHFGHPDRDVRRYYVDWFKTFADIIADLGGNAGWPARGANRRYRWRAGEGSSDPRRVAQPAVEGAHH